MKGSRSRHQSTECGRQMIIMQDISEILNRIHLIFAEELQLEPDQVDDDVNFSTGLGLDSLAIYSAITEIEDSFGIVLNDSDIEGLSTINDVSVLVYNKLNGITAAVSESPEEEPVEYHRITDFADSEEYIALKKREKDTLEGGFNPYFVPHDSLIRDTSIVYGKEVINLGSYNYLGMSGNPETMQAAIDAIKKYGTSASGSRTLAGEKTLYQQLEKAIADWKHTETPLCARQAGQQTSPSSAALCVQATSSFMMHCPTTP